MKKLPPMRFAHLGFAVRDLEKMTDFYTRIVGMVVTDSGDYSRGGQIRFLTGNPADHHQIVFTIGRAEDSPTTINQISFRMQHLEDLRQAYAMLADETIEELRTRNHGNAWSLYFLDPEGNRIEMYVTSPWYVSQPHSTTLDLTKPAEQIIAETKEFVSGHPSWQPVEKWSANMREKFAEPAQASMQDTRLT